MTRTQSFGILTGMLTTVEASGLSEHNSLHLGRYNAMLTIFLHDEEVTPAQIKNLLKDMVPDVMAVETSTITETLTNYVAYELNY